MSDFQKRTAMESSENLVVFSHANAGVIIINNFDKFNLVGTIICLLVVHIYLTTPKYPILTYILAFIPLFASVIVVMFSSKFAHKISFDFDEEEFSFLYSEKKEQLLSVYKM
jgi:hypothetical protein